MKIGSKIKPRSGEPRHVSMHGTEYAFAPMKDKQGVTHFVAEVDNSDAAAAFLEHGAFYAFDKALQPAPKLTRGTGDQKHDGDPPPSPQSFPADIGAEAAKLLDNTVEALNVEVGKVSSLDVVRCALQLEHAGSARKTAIGVLEATLAAANEAGVKG